MDELNQRPKPSAIGTYAVYLFNFTRIVFIFLTKLSIDFNCYDYFSRFQPRWQGLLYTSYVLLNFAVEVILLEVDSLDGLASYFLSVTFYVATFGALLLATNFGAVALDQYFPYKPDVLSFEARSRLVNSDDIAACSQCSICLVEYKVGDDKIC